MIGGVDFVPWVIAGLFGFFLFRENMLRSLGAVAANKALFAYRQVKPVDSVFVRCFIEGTIRSFVFILFILCAELIGINLFPDRPLESLVLWCSLWLLGAGFGLTFSALAVLVPETARIVRLTSLPLLIISGVMFPIQYAPEVAQNYLLLNPIIHGLELLREFFFDSYRTVNNISYIYLMAWIIGLNLLGLILHIRFSQRLKIL